ncbi:MAG: CbiX/SirB N-terminal domain-containing protein [Burkholderiales bacterium]
MPAAIILFAHGAREPEWALPFERIRDQLRAAGMRVELAFLEFMSPSLEDAAARLAGEGIEAVTIVPLFLAQGGHLKRELPEMVARIREHHAKTGFRVTAPLGEAPEIVAAITAWVQRTAR